MSQTVSKADYARLKNVSAARVSQWISEKKIDGAALDGEGRGAKIRVELADRQLRERLDLSQRVGNGLGTRLDEQPGPAAAVLPLTEAPPAAPATQSPGDTIELAFKRERLEAIQRDNRKRAEEEAARAGRFVDSQEAAVQMAKIAGRTIAIIEASLPEIAAAMAAKFGQPQRDFLHVLRTEFRNVRQRAAQSLRDGAGELPEVVEASVDDAEEVEAA